MEGWFEDHEGKGESMGRSGGHLKCSCPDERVLCEGLQLEINTNSSRICERNRPKEACASLEGPEGGLG